jgi:hypothetical protein
MFKLIPLAGHVFSHEMIIEHIAVFIIISGAASNFIISK